MRENTICPKCKEPMEHFAKGEAHLWVCETCRLATGHGKELDALMHTPEDKYARMREVNRARQLAKTHCPYGHPYAGANLHVYKSGARRCRACQRARGLRKREEERLERKTKGL